MAYGEELVILLAHQDQDEEDASLEAHWEDHHEVHQDVLGVHDVLVAVVHDVQEVALLGKEEVLVAEGLPGLLVVVVLHPVEDQEQAVVLNQLAVPTLKPLHLAFYSLYILLLFERNIPNTTYKPTKLPAALLKLTFCLMV